MPERAQRDADCGANDGEKYGDGIHGRSSCSVASRRQWPSPGLDDVAFVPTLFGVEIAPAFDVGAPALGAAAR